MKKKLIAVAALLAVPFAMTSCGRKTINLNDYITIETEGYDTVGKAHYYFDSEQLIEDNLEVFGLDEESGFALLDVIDKVESNLDGELDKTENISNGDRITFKWDESGKETLEEKYKISLKYGDKTLDVEGLEEAKTFNPFDHISVSFSGIAPNGEATVSINDTMPVTGLNIEADKRSGLSAGDTIKVTVGDGAEAAKDYCFARGYIPIETEKEYTVEGLSSYVQKLDEIPTDAFDKMNQHAQDTFKAHVAENWSEAEGLKNIELIGNYLFTPKDASVYAETNNTLYFVYKITAKDLRKDDKKAEFDYYYYSYYNDIILLEDGTCSFDLGTLTKPDGYMSWGEIYGEAFEITSHDDKDYWYQGYKDLDSLFNKHVTAKIDRYNYETTVKE